MNSLISQSPIRGDAEQNLRMSYNLYQNGVISNATPDKSDKVELSPSNYREPVPIIVNALFMVLHPEIDRSASFESLQSGIHTKHIKQANLLWILLLLIGACLISYLLSSSRWVPFAVLFLIYMYFIRFGSHFDVLTTELHTATLIILTSLFLFIALRKKTIIWYVFTGILLGLLVLTKAIFFYLFIVVIPFIYFFENRNKSLVKIVSLTGAVLLIIMPWMIRNYTVYGSFEITQRAGAVLHLRATQNRISGEELKGAIYYWGPELYRDLVQNTSLGAKKSDFKEGGKFESLNKGDVFFADSIAVAHGRPDQAIKYYSASRAEINRLQKELGDESSEGPRRQAYQIMKEESLKMILDNPVRHTLMSFPFLWRGIWCLPNSTLPFLPDKLQIYIHNIMNLLSYLSLYIMFITGIMRKKAEWVAVTILPVSMLLIHAFITQNITRFSEPIIPSMLLSFIILIHPAIDTLCAVIRDKVSHK